MLQARPRERRGGPKGHRLRQWLQPEALRYAQAADRYRSVSLHETMASLVQVESPCNPSGKRLPDRAPGREEEAQGLILESSVLWSQVTILLFA